MLDFGTPPLVHGVQMSNMGTGTGVGFSTGWGVCHTLHQSLTYELMEVVILSCLIRL